MAKPRLSTRLSCISCACTIPSIHAHGMRVFPMFITVTIEPYIAQPATTPFRWGWDFNHLVPWMLHYPLRPHRRNRPMIKPKLTKPLGSLNKSNTSTNMFRIFWRSLMQSTSNAMINTKCHTSFGWEIKFGCTCRKNTLHDPIENLHPPRYGTYTITKVLGDNAFELNIPPFLCLNLVFNVDLLRPYLPPLLDTTKIK
jgi:hypothetical protein